MNRIQLLGKDSASNPELKAGFTVPLEVGRQSQVARGVPHVSFAPLHYEPNYAYPLLVWLHGPGDDERQLQRIMPLVSIRNYVAVAPRGNAKLRSGFTWDHEPEALAAAEQSVFDAIEAAMARFRIEPRRVFLGGFQCGGTAAVHIALRSPRRFGGAMTFGGAFPARLAPLAQLDAARIVPLLIAQGKNSKVYPEDRLCNDLRLCHAAGLSVSIRHYQCGDDLTTQMLRDLDAWMMEIVTGERARPLHPPVIPIELN